MFRSTTAPALTEPGDKKDPSNSKGCHWPVPQYHLSVDLVRILICTWKAKILPASIVRCRGWEHKSCQALLSHRNPPSRTRAVRLWGLLRLTVAFMFLSWPKLKVWVGSFQPYQKESGKWNQQLLKLLVQRECERVIFDNFMVCDWTV